MSSYAQDWVWCHSKAKGLVKFVFLAIARLMGKNHHTTPPTPVDELVKATGLAHATVRRGISALESEGEIAVLKANQRGTVHRYKLVIDPQLPLVDLDPRSHDPQCSQGAVPALTQSSDQCSHRAVPVLTGSTESAPLSICTDLVRTEDPSAARPLPAAEAFLTWFRAEYPKHRHGALTTIDWRKDTDAILGLLATGRTVERLQQMAEVMWTMTPREDKFLANAADRGVKLLCHAADRLDALAVLRAAAVVPQRPVPRDTSDQRLLRVVRQLLAREGEGGPLGEACGAVRGLLPEHRTDEDLAYLNTMLLVAARQVVDVDALEVEARAELAPFKVRMSEPEYQRTFGLSVDRLVRERAKLPDLRDLVTAERKEAHG